VYSFGTQAQRSLQELTLHGEAATNERLSQLVAATRTEMGKHLRCAEGQSALFERLAGVRPSRPSLCHPVCQPSPTPTARVYPRRQLPPGPRARGAGVADRPCERAETLRWKLFVERLREETAGACAPAAARLLALHDVDVGTPEFRTLGGAYLRAACQLRPRELGAPPEPLAGGVPPPPPSSSERGAPFLRRAVRIVGAPSVRSSGGGESFLRVHWVAVPKALRARRVSRRRRRWRRRRRRPGQHLGPWPACSEGAAALVERPPVPCPAE
jgi:hypothetical protein